MTVHRAGLIALVVFVAGIGLAAATFPWHAHDRITSTYVGSLGAGCAGAAWAIALLVSPRWRRLGVGFAIIATIYIAVFAVLLIRVLPD